MKLPSRFAPPPLDKSASLPLLLGTLLSAAFVFQFAAAEDVELPPAGPGGGAAAGSPRETAVAPAAGGPVVIARSLFAPAAAPAGDGAANPLAGVMVAGSIRIGGSTLAVVQGPGDRISNIRIGGRIGDWRLRAIRANDALLVRGAEALTVPFGARGVLSTPSAAARSQ